MKKIIIFDSGVIITLALSGLLPVLKKLREEFNGEFLITNDVKREIIDMPLRIKEFELNALQIRHLLDVKIIQLPIERGFDNNIIAKRAIEIQEKANHLYKAGEDYIHIIDSGEASCLALSVIASQINIDNIIAIDERTTRLLGEMPENLREILENKLHIKVIFNAGVASQFKKIKFVRSSELMFLAFRKGLLEAKTREMLDAVLYSTKFKGASITREEINELKALASISN